MAPRDSVRVRTEARTGTSTATRPAGPAPGPDGPAPRRRVPHRGPLSRAIGFGRTIWRQLTSMRTALILLFLLALASLPGALLPQWELNTSKTARYMLAHPVLGKVLNALGFFNVFSSPWYSAIYLLLFISLVGCLTPRTFEFIGQWRAKPVATPRNLARMPHHARVATADEPAAAAERIRRSLRHKGIGGWRTTVRTEPGGVRTVSAERGYLREIGNLVFHFSILGMLIAVAIGSLFGFKGSLIVVTGNGFCSATPIAYDNFRPGRLVSGTDMAPFCVNVTGFHATYTAIGEATSFTANLRVQSGSDLGTSTWRSVQLHPNEPLRIAGQSLYLLGHGFAPTFTVRYPDGQVRHYAAPFPTEDSMFTSQGVVKITDPPGYTGDALKKHQLAIVGIFAPTARLVGGVLTSGYPKMLNPMVAVEIYRGELGVDTGAAQSVFAIDKDQVAKGLLVSQGRKNLMPGQSMTLDDGTVITFTGAEDYVTLQTTYEPAGRWVLVFAILLVAGLLTSLTIKRRRVWYRISPAGPDGGAPEASRTLSASVATARGTDASAGAERAASTEPPGHATGSTIEIGGLARTDQAGYGTEFSSLVALAGDAHGEQAIPLDDATIVSGRSSGPDEG